MSKTYDQVKAGQWVQPVKQGYRMECCDCGLVHTLDFRIFRGRVQLRARRNNRATGQIRRHSGIYPRRLSSRVSAILDRQTAPGSTIFPNAAVRPFRTSDYVALHEAILQANGIRMVENPVAVGAAYGAGGPAFTAFLQGAIPMGGWENSYLLGSAGLVIQWPGRATAWAVLSPELRRQPRLALWFTSRLKGTLRRLMVEHRLHRVEADVWAKNGTGIRWLKAIGFGSPLADDPNARAPEAFMESYGPNGEDAYRYVLLRPLPHSIPLHPTGGA